MALPVHRGECSVMRQVETRGGAAWVRSVLRGGLLLSAISSSSAAQGVVRSEDVRVGSEQERYLRALSVLSPHASWSIRPLEGERALRALAGSPGPWRVDTVVRRDGLRGHGGSVDAIINGGLPSYTADGPAWSGRGINLRASGTVLVQRGPLLIRVAPVAWVAQNVAFDLLPNTGLFPWSDAARPGNIDLPQRFGREMTARVDPGESTLELRAKNVRLALTSAAAHLGPGSDHSLLMQGEAGGIPRLELGTRGGLRTRVGTFAGQVAWGRTPRTGWAPDQPSDALFTSYLVGTWRPSFVERLEIGMVRLTHRAWERMSARELLVPFGSVYSAKWVGGSYETENDNQIATLFAHLRVPESGLEFFAEFGKNDRSAGWRDQILEPDHNTAWLVGTQRAWRDARARLWALNLTAVSGSISPITRFRGQDIFYEHSRMTQGHTLRGQLLGTPLLQREGGAELRLDRYDARGRTGLLVRTRSLPNQIAESVPPDMLRQEWSAMVDVLRWTRRGAVRARIGGVADLGYSPVKGDVYSLHFALGHDLR